MFQNVKKNYFEQKKILSVGRSIGVLVGSITCNEIDLITSNLVYKWVSIGERFGLFLHYIGLGEGDEMGG